ncbi:MAG: FtsW/RodA/SpoVE family cell cycle protein [Lachnospiraceae bacterium]
MAIQVIFNICVVLNIFPTTGVTLPLVSYGGTALLIQGFEICIALSVSRRITFVEETEKKRRREVAAVHT